MNPKIAELQPYPFQKLAQLKQGITPPAHKAPIALSIGEPKHPTPALITDALIANLGGLSGYPTTRGLPALRETISAWLTQRFALPTDTVDPERHVLPVAGTREALFSITQAVCGNHADGRVLMPNPFYQIYEGAALLAGMQPYFLNTTAATGYLPDFSSVPDAVWRDCRLLFICTPGNPSGAVLPLTQLQELIRLAEQHDFIIAADECYSEIYFDEAAPPPGLLQAAAAMGNTDYSRCLVFHSLSKRSNAPGLRSGFVAGDAAIIEAYFQYRTYHGATLSLPVQHASIAAWQDETHVRENRRLYAEKFARVTAILAPALPVTMPDAAFYLWPQVPGSDTAFARELYAATNVTVLPGSYLSRDAHGSNPGAGQVRMALVAPLPDCVDAATRIVEFLAAKP